MDQGRRDRVIGRALVVAALGLGAVTSVAVGDPGVRDAGFGNETGKAYDLGWTNPRPIGDPVQFGDGSIVSALLDGGDLDTFRLAVQRHEREGGQVTGSFSTYTTSGLSEAEDLNGNPPAGDGALTKAPGGMVVVAKGDRAGEVRAQRLDVLGTGLPDPSFGPNGTAAFPTPGSQPTVSGAVVLADGRTLLAGSYLGDAAVPVPFVARLRTDGTLDPAYGIDGVASGPAGVRTAGTGRLAARPDGTAFLAVQTAPRRFGVLRVGTSGQVVTSGGFAGGVLELPLEVSRAEDVAVASDDSVVAVGWQQGPDIPDAYDTSIGVVARIGADDRLDPDFGDGGVDRTEPDGIQWLKVAHDALDRAMVAGVAISDGGSPPYVDRFLRRNPVNNSSPRDGAWRGGPDEIDCHRSTPTGLAYGGPDELLMTLDCREQSPVPSADLMRYHTRPAVPSASLATVGSTARPAGRREVAVNSVDSGAFQGDGSIASAPLRGIPLRGIPLRGIPLRGIPLRGIGLNGAPLRGIPLRGIPLRGIPLRGIPLRGIPLRGISGDDLWPVLLAGTRFEGVPLEQVTLQDVLDLDTPDARSLTLNDVDFSRSALADLSLAALLLGPLPIGHLPEPEGGWCPLLDGQPFSCANGVDPAVTPLLALEAAGDDLSAYDDAIAVPLPDELEVDGQPIPVASLQLRDLVFEETELGRRRVDALLPQLACLPGCELVRDVPDDSWGDRSLADLFANTYGDDRPSLDAVLETMIRPEDRPFETADLARLLDAAPKRAVDNNEYRADFVFECRQTTSDGVDVVVEPPPGAREGAEPARYVFASGDEGTTTGRTDEEGRIVFALPKPDGCVPDDRAEGYIELQAEPSTTLGAFRANLRVAVAGGESDLAKADAANVVDDSDDADGNGTGPVYVNQADGELARTGHISAPSDVDVFSIDAPAPQQRLTITLSHLPFDADVEVFGAAIGPPVTPDRETARGAAATARTAQLADEDPGDLVAGTTGGTAPLPGELAGRDVVLRGRSAQRGTLTEAVTIVGTEADQGTRLYVRVTGAHGATSPEPYVARFKRSPAPVDLTCVAARDWEADTAPQVTNQWGAGATTLFLLNHGRMTARHGAGATARVMDKLAQVAAEPKVRGAVLPVDALPGADVEGAYRAWDADPCSGQKANGVVDAINRVVDRWRGNRQVRHIVVVGDDDLMPQARVPDQTAYANEDTYADTAAIGGRDTPVSRALRTASVLSDDPYGDFDPQAFLGGHLYIADVALGRLVESPADIEAQLDRYLGSNGGIDGEDAYVSGYDFLEDGAEQVATNAEPLGGDVTRAIGDEWTAADARAALTQGTAGFTSLNAHYDHFRLLPAKTATDAGVPDLVTASQVQFAGRRVFAVMGCHSGLSVPAIDGATGATATKLVDWPQRAAAGAAAWIGNTGYGYGDDVAIGWTERLVADFTRGLAGDGGTIGQQLMLAKQRYVAALAAQDPYDAKVVQQATLYGLPFWTATGSGVVADTPLPAVDPTPPATPSLRSEPRSFVSSFDPPQERDGGRFWTVDGQPPQLTHDRPLQPRLERDVTAADGFRVHGALITALESRDLDGIQPVLARPVSDDAAAEPPARPGVTSFPDWPVAVTERRAVDGPRDQLVVVPGQFTSDDARRGVGTQRLFDRVDVSVLRSDGGDWTPPRVTQASGAVIGAAAAFEVVTDDLDTTRVLVLFQGDRSDAWYPVELSGEGRRWTSSRALADGSTRIERYLVQAVDPSGNVGHDSGKGPGLPPSEQGFAASGMRIEATPALSAGGFADGPVRLEPVALDDAQGNPTALGEVSASVDGGPPRLVPDAGVLVEDPGLHTVRMYAERGPRAILSFAIDDGGPSVIGTPDRVPNGSGFYTAPVTVTWRCEDGAGVRSCPAPTRLDADDPAAVARSGPAEDRFGNTSTGTAGPFAIDLLAPKVRIQAATTTILTPIGGSVHGTVSDTVSGPEKVTVAFKPLIGATKVVTARLTCATALSCTWTVPTPTTGVYVATATATDRAGRSGASSSPTFVTVG